LKKVAAFDLQRLQEALWRETEQSEEARAVVLKIVVGLKFQSTRNPDFFN
jgi:hypothetical protein